MRAQLSLEFLIVLLSAAALLSAMLPLMQQVKDVSNSALSLRNAQLILDKLYYSCERVSLSGENETITVNSLSNYSVQNISGTLLLYFRGYNLSKENFKCSVSQNFSKGRASLTLSPGG